jgi:hypothetical protein
LQILKLSGSGSGTISAPAALKIVRLFSISLITSGLTGAKKPATPEV